MRSTIFQAVVLSGAALALSACGAEASTDQAAAAATELPLEMSDAHLVLPPVSGNPGAVYFELTNTGERNFAIRSAEVEGAGSADIHGSMEMDGEIHMSTAPPQLIEAGQTIRFEPGDVHVMAFDLSPELKAGGTTDLTLIVAGGKRATFPVEIRGAGDDR